MALVQLLQLLEHQQLMVVAVVVVLGSHRVKRVEPEVLVVVALEEIEVLRELLQLLILAGVEADQVVVHQVLELEVVEVQA